jgi:hypothetical protein
LTPDESRRYDFIAGRYQLEVLGKIVGRKMPLSLAVIELSIDKHGSELLHATRNGIYFDWSPATRSYTKNIRSNMPKVPNPLKLLEALQDGESLQSKNR